MLQKLSPGGGKPHETLGFNAGNELMLSAGKLGLEG